MSKLRPLEKLMDEYHQYERKVCRPTQYVILVGFIALYAYWFQYHQELSQILPELAAIGGLGITAWAISAHHHKPNLIRIMGRIRQELEREPFLVEWLKTDPSSDEDRTPEDDLRDELRFILRKHRNL